MRTIKQHLDYLRGSSVKIGTMRRILAWPLNKDDAQIEKCEQQVSSTCELKNLAGSVIAPGDAARERSAVIVSTVGRLRHSMCIAYRLIMHM